MKVFSQKTVLPEKYPILLKEKKRTGIFKNDCLNCFFSTIFIIVFLLNPIVSKCKHLNQNHNGNAVYKPIKSVRILGLLCLISCFIGNLVYFRKFFETKNYVLFIGGLYNFIKTEIILLIMIILLLKLPIRVEYISRLSYIFESKKFYGINNLICGHCAKLIKKCIYYMIYGSLLILVVYPLIYYTQYGRDAFNYSNVVYFLIASFQSVLFYNYCAEFVVLRLIYRSVHITLTNHLEKRRNHVYSDIVTFPLEEKLKRISHLYIELRNCLDIILDYVGFAYIFSTIFILFLVILNIYSVFLILTSDDGCCIWLAQINIFSQLWVLLNLIIYTKGASEQAAETLTYLFNYPFSILKQREALQVELIIKTLVVKSPRIAIQNMLTLDTGFIASIAGTLVTFSMVVIQLHIVLDKNDMNVQNNTDSSTSVCDYLQ